MRRDSASQHARTDNRAPVGIVAAILATLVVVCSGGVASAQTLEVDFRGELIRSDAIGLSGVFPMNVALTPIDGDEAAEPFLSEAHFISVVHGDYHIRMGQDSPLDDARAGSLALLVVMLGESEIVRQEIQLDRAPEVPVGAEPYEEYFIYFSADKIEVVTFAEVADRALSAREAQNATDCTTLEGHTYDEILTALGHLEGELARHDRHRSHDSAQPVTSSGVRVGSATNVLESIGGAGGQRYTRTCGTDQVAVGMRGGAAALVDSFELICAPIE